MVLRFSFTTSKSIVVQHHHKACFNAVNIFGGNTYPKLKNENILRCLNVQKMQSIVGFQVAFHQLLYKTTVASVTRLDELLDFGPLFKAFGNN